jgi:hypothetical protein
MRSRNDGFSPGHLALRLPLASDFTGQARPTHRHSNCLETLRPAPSHRGRSLDPPNQRANIAQFCQLWKCQTGHQRRRHSGTNVTALGRHCRGCLRLHYEHGAGDPGRLVTAPTCSSKHLTLGANTSPSSEGTQRVEPAQVGRVHPKPPRCSPFGDANGVRNP